MVDATVTLYKDIGLDANYNRSMLFNDKTTQNTWFSSISSEYKTTLTNVNYNKLQNSFYVHDELGDVYNYTYVRLQNIDDSGRIYYGFISNVTLVDEETTRFDIVLDPIQTFMGEWKLGECYVYKEHVDRWDTGTQPTRITPGQEGISANMVVSNCKEIVTPNTITDTELVFGIIAFTSTRKFIITDVPPSSAENGVRDNGMYYAVIPLYRDVSKANIPLYYRCSQDGSSTAGKETQNLRLPTYNEFAGGVAPAVLGIDPNSVLGAYIIPAIGGQINAYSYNDTYAITLLDVSTNLTQYYGVRGDVDTPIPMYPLTIWTAQDGTVATDGEYGCQLFRNQDIFSLMDTNRVYVSIADSISKPTKPTNNAMASDTYEPALYMYPYMVRSIISNGAIVGNIPDVAVFTDTTPNIKVCTNIKANGVQNYFYYGSIDDRIERNTEIAQGDCFIAGANTVDVIGDNYMSYCLTARDSDRRMMWSSIASNTLNQAVFMGYGGALVGSRSNSGKNDPKKNPEAVDVAGYGKAMLSAMGMGVASSLITSGISGVDMWIQQEAKEQTIRNTPPDTVALGSGSAIVETGEFGYYFVERKCDDVNWKTAYDRFRHYGYTVNKIEVPNLKSRKYYNYICTVNTTVIGPIPANIKQDLVNIFEKGITFFHADNCNSTEYPKNTSGAELENIERSLIT